MIETICPSCAAWGAEYKKGCGLCRGAGTLGEDWKATLLAAHKQAERKQRERQEQDRIQGIEEAKAAFSVALRGYLGLLVPVDQIRNDGGERHHVCLSVRVDGIEFTWQPGNYRRSHQLQARQDCECGGYRYSYPIAATDDFAAWLESGGTHGESHRCCVPEPEEGEVVQIAAPPRDATPAERMREAMREALREYVLEVIEGQVAPYPEAEL